MQSGNDVTTPQLYPYNIRAVMTVSGDLSNFLRLSKKTPKQSLFERDRGLLLLCPFTYKTCAIDFVLFVEVMNR